MPGVVYVDHGARYDPIVPGELDRGGAINTITPHNVTSKNAAGEATSGFLVDIERVDIFELRGNILKLLTDLTTGPLVCGLKEYYMEINRNSK